MTTPRDQLLAAFQDLDPVTNFTVPSHEWSVDVCKAYMAGRKMPGIAGMMFVWWRGG